MIVLDTNVVSELMRPSPTPAVVDWMAARPAASLFTTALTQAEILRGLRLLADGQRRRGLSAAAEAMFAEDFADRVLSFDQPAARSYAEIAVARKAMGRPIAEIDAQLVAIAHSRGAAVATRNISDFELCGVPLVNPWDSR